MKFWLKATRITSQWFSLLKPKSSWKKRKVWKASLVWVFLLKIKKFSSYVIVNFKFTYWDPPEHINSKLELVISPESFGAFKELAASVNLDFKINSKDLQSVIDAEKPKKQRKAFTLNDYNTLDEINQFLDDMEAANPDVASVFIVGESYEGRTIKGIKLSTNDNNPGIFIEANIHAREWISSATAVWIINEILTTSEENWKPIIDSVTWYIVPVINPDGKSIHILKIFVTHTFVSRLRVHLDRQPTLAKDKIDPQHSMPRCWSEQKLWLQLQT